MLDKILAKTLNRKTKDRIVQNLYKYKYNLNVGKGSRIKSPTKIGTNTQIGRYTNIQKNVEIRDGNGVTIGNFCAIADNVRIQSTNHQKDSLSLQYRLHNSYLDIPPPKSECGGISIGHDVWIGTGAIILPEVEIGNGAIIGAGAVVTKDVDEYEIVGGNPAKNIGFRFDKETRESLKDLEWWFWDMDKIKRNKNLFKGVIEDSRGIIENI